MDEATTRHYRQLMLSGLGHLSRLDNAGDGWELMPTYLTWQNGDEIQIFIRPLGENGAGGFEFSDHGETERKLQRFYALDNMPLVLMANPGNVRYENGMLTATSHGDDLLHVYHRILFVIGLMLGAGYKAREQMEGNRPPA